MSALFIKILAIVFMLADHIGYSIGSSGFASIDFGDGYYFLRAIGRLSLPLFAFLIANGFRHTRSVPKYAMRLFAFAIISEIPFDLFVSGKITLVTMNGILPDIHLDNIFFTLLIGLVFLWLNDFYKKRQIKYAKLLSVATFIFLSFFAAFISADYGVTGVGFVALFGVFNVEDKNKIPMLFVGFSVLAYWKLIARSILVVVYRSFRINLVRIPIISHLFSGYNPIMALIQTAALLSLAFILFYNQKSGMPKSRVANAVLKYSFYVFYPVHLLILYFAFG
ncbi:MAG: hypothetical protein IJA60_08555 [Clostridia bacterium]|nr:hypothetical protein [Clostridia bacterium]